MSPEHTASVIVDLQAALAEEGRSLDDNFQLVITPPYQVTPDMVRAYADLGVDRLVVHLGSQKTDRIDARLKEMEGLVAAA